MNYTERREALAGELPKLSREGLELRLLKQEDMISSLSDRLLDQIAQKTRIGKAADAAHKIIQNLVYVQTSRAWVIHEETIKRLNINMEEMQK